MTAAFARANLAQPELTLVTSESSPLRLFGPDNSAEIRKLLEEAGVSLVVGRHATEFRRDELRDIADCHADEQGFVVTDANCRIAEAPRVFVAGDAGSFPVKQGGIAAQQANIVARSIAKELGAVEDAPAFRPVLDGTLLSGSEAYRLRSSLITGTADSADHEVRAAWMPIAKIAAPHLTAFLAMHSGAASARPEIDADQLEKDLRGAHESKGRTRYGDE